MMEINKNQLSILAPKERYEQELDDANWKLKANLIRNRDNRECQLCGAKKTHLDVHHIRYISGHKAWEYDATDLVTLCHKCHEDLHDWQDFEGLVDGSYYYDKFFEGVGVVEHKQFNGIWFHACWTGLKHYEEDGHGRLYIEDFSPRENIRKATTAEIKDFWDKVERYYDVDSIIYDFGKHLKNLLPDNHPIRIKARNRFKEAIDIYNQQLSFIRETFNFTLLISDEYFALLEGNHIDTYPYGWPPYELPRRYFKVAPIKDVKEKPLKDNRRQIDFNELDFSKCRAATTEELQEWLEYEEHLANQFDDDFPF